MFFRVWKQQNINPRGNCVGSSEDEISATLLLPEAIAVPAITGFHETAESTLDDASVDQTDVIITLRYILLRGITVSIKSSHFLRVV